ncbi:MAG: bifunctional UDP-N-acetylmuramoyl-tripeptide:D-alanyl-D-alanine ligase/alanine racemase [Salibacteraceae bacterium]
MNYTIESIVDFCKGQSHILYPGSKVGRINIDHRNSQRDNCLFVAIKGARYDGHDFIPELLDYGVRHFLVSDPDVVSRYKNRANFIVVDNIIEALQMIAAEHRDNYSTSVLSITGSNGKTIVKEWLNTLLELDFTICRSPKSYNSQIGVPLSVFAMGSNDTLAIFEAGISQKGEMENLERILKPTWGVFTNLGDAHSVHFNSDQEKLAEKWRLFKEVEKVVACKDQKWVKWLDEKQRAKCFFWSFRDQSAPVYFSDIIKNRSATIMKAEFENNTYQFEVPFTDRASIENAGHCFAVLCLLGILKESTISRFDLLTPISMRMQVKQGIEDSLIIDDTYNSDIESLRASVDQLAKHTDRDKWVIMSDLGESQNNERVYKEIAHMLKEAEVTRIIAIGPNIGSFKRLFEPMSVQCFENVDLYWNQLDTTLLSNKAILIKGSRRFKLEKLSTRLQAKQRITTLEIDLLQLEKNLKYIQSKLQPRTKTMVMVKAFAYGSGSFEIAHFFQSQKTIDFLVVAYADEGIILREKGISTPIMVMSPSNTAYESMINHNIEPEIYSLNGLKDFIQSAKSMRHFFDKYPIHLKVNTGMNRLGFDSEMFSEALELIVQTSFLFVRSIFTHLSVTDDPSFDDFTHDQVKQFSILSEIAVKKLGYQPDRHVLNSNGVLRFPEYHFEMVRLGIGLYGFSVGEHNKHLHPLGTLKSYIVQIRTVKAGDSVGYARQGIAQRKRQIATVALGYADGLDRRLGNGNWSINWQGIDCPIVGNICMDMTMIDVTDTQAQEGDEVVVFEGSRSIEKMANTLETIPYEILTNIPERVRRVYLQE